MLFIFLSYTFNSKICTDGQNFEISGYFMLRAHYSSNNKKGGVGFFYMKFVPLRVLNISYLSEWITFEIIIGNKLCCFIHLYRSPSQTQDEFQTFKSNLKLNLYAFLCGNLFLAVIIGYFNSKSKDWCSKFRRFRTWFSLFSVSTSRK